MSYGPQTTLLYSLAAFLGATNMILWGIYADLLVEEFRWKKVLRSYLFALLYALLLSLAYPELNLFIVCLSIIGLERLTTEIYKAFFRVEDQSKYKIPSHLGIHWPYPVKVATGVVMVIALIVVWLIPNLSLTTHKAYIIALTGMLIALGGMLKDAPHEGFDALKFWRSPALTVVAGGVIWWFFPTLPLVPYLFSIGGFERIMSECYKKIVRKKVPGKFKEATPYNKEWFGKRDLLLPLYVIDLILIIALLWV